MEMFSFCKMKGPHSLRQHICVPLSYRVSWCLDKYLYWVFVISKCACWPLWVAVG